MTQTYIHTKHYSGKNIRVWMREHGYVAMSEVTVPQQVKMTVVSSFESVAEHSNMNEQT